MYKNIIFDMSEVIITGIHGVEKDIESNFGILADEYEKRRLEVNSLFLDVMRGKITENEYMAIFLKDTGWKTTEEDIKRIIRNYLGRPIAGTKEIIQKLKNTNKYNLILLSDYPAEWKEEVLKKREELQIFNKKYFSCDFGLVKADLECFEYMIKDSKINPKETIFIDDYKNNIENAEKLGIKGILFKNEEQLEKELNILEII